MITFTPPVIAHRGASAYAPENTIAAFAKAKELGSRWIEVDVMLSADNELVIFHDDNLVRTTNGRGPLVLMTSIELNTLDAGSWFDASFSKEKIPTLTEFMQFITKEKLAANIELKELPGQEESFALRFLEEISVYLENQKASLLFSSFSLPTLEWLRHYSPECQIGLLMHEWRDNWQAECEKLACVSLHANHEILNYDRIRRIKESQHILLAYTVNKKSLAEKLFSLGVDAVFSDYPDLLSHAW